MAYYPCNEAGILVESEPGATSNMDGQSSHPDYKVDGADILWLELPQDVIQHCFKLLDIENKSSLTVSDWRAVADALGLHQQDIASIESSTQYANHESPSRYMFEKYLKKEFMATFALHHFLDILDRHQCLQLRDDIIENLKDISRQVKEKRLKRPFSVLSSLPSALPGIGSFCHKSEKDQKSYKAFIETIPCEYNNNRPIDRNSRGSEQSPSPSGSSGNVSASSMETDSRPPNPIFTTFQGQCDILQVTAQVHQPLMEVEHSSTNTSLFADMGSMEMTEMLNNETQVGAYRNSWPRAQTIQSEAQRRENKPHTEDATSRSSQSIPEAYLQFPAPYRTTGPLKVFISYLYQGKTELVEAMRLCRCLQKNLFKAYIDDFQMKATDIRNFYDQADFVIICICPGFKKNIKLEILRKDHSKDISHWLEREVEGKDSVSNDNTPSRLRLIPVLCCGATEDDIPGWMLNAWRCSIQTDQIYVWPRDFRNLFWFMLRPRLLLERLAAVPPNSV